MNKKGNALLSVLVMSILIGLLITMFVSVTNPKFKIQNDVTLDGTIIGNNSGSGDSETPTTEYKNLLIEVYEKEHTKALIKNFSFFDNAAPDVLYNQTNNPHKFIVGHNYTFTADSYLPSTYAIKKTYTSPFKVYLTKEIPADKHQLQIIETNNVPFEIFDATIPNSPALKEINKQNKIYYELVVGRKYTIKPKLEQDKLLYQDVELTIADSSSNIKKFTFIKNDEQLVKHNYVINITNAKSFILRESVSLETINIKNGFYELAEGKTYRIDSNVDFDTYAPYYFTVTPETPVEQNITLDKFFTINVTNTNSFIIYPKGSTPSDKLTPRADGKYKITEGRPYVIESSAANKDKYDSIDYIVRLNTNANNPINLVLPTYYDIRLFDGTAELTVDFKVFDSKGKLISPTAKGYKLGSGNYRVEANKYLPQEFNIPNNVINDTEVNIKLDSRYRITVTNPEITSFIVIENTTKAQINPTGTENNLYDLKVNNTYIIKGTGNNSKLTYTLEIFENTTHDLRVTLSTYYNIRLTNPVGFYIILGSTEITGSGTSYKLDPNTEYTISPNTTEGNYSKITFIPNKVADENNNIVLSLDRIYTFRHDKSYGDYTVDITPVNGTESQSVALNNTDKLKLRAGETYIATETSKSYHPYKFVAPDLPESNSILIGVYKYYSVNVKNVGVDPNNIKVEGYNGWNWGVINENRWSSRYDINNNYKQFRISMKEDNNNRFGVYVGDRTADLPSNIDIYLNENYTIEVFDNNTEITDFKVFDKSGNNILITNSRYSLHPTDTYEIRYNYKGEKFTSYDLYIEPSIGVNPNKDNLITVYVGDTYTINVTNDIEFIVKEKGTNIEPNHTGNKYLLTPGKTYIIQAKDQNKNYIPYELLIDENIKSYDVTLPRKFNFKSTTLTPLNELYIYLDNKKLAVPIVSGKYEQTLYPGTYFFETIAGYAKLSVFISDSTPNEIDLQFMKNSFFEEKDILLPDTTIYTVKKEYKDTKLDVANQNDKLIIVDNIVQKATLDTLTNNLTTVISETESNAVLHIVGSLEFPKNYSNVKIKSTESTGKNGLYTHEYVLEFQEISDYIIGTPTIKNYDYKIVIDITYDIRNVGTNDAVKSVQYSTHYFKKLTSKGKYEKELPMKIASNEIKNLNIINQEITKFLQNYHNEVNKTFSGN